VSGNPGPVYMIGEWEALPRGIPVLDRWMPNREVPGVYGDPPARVTGQTVRGALVRWTEVPSWKHKLEPPAANDTLIELVYFQSTWGVTVGCQCMEPEHRRKVERFDRLWVWANAGPDQDAWHDGMFDARLGEKMSPYRDPGWVVTVTRPDDVWQFRLRELNKKQIAAEFGFWTGEDAEKAVQLAKMIRMES